MTARNEFDIINAIAKSTGEAALMVRVEGHSVPCRIPVKMVNVNVETDTDGTRVSIPCEAILPTVDFKRNYLGEWDEDKPKVSIAIDWNKLAKQRLNEIYGSKSMYLTTATNDKLKNLAHEYLKNDIINTIGMHEMFKATAASANPKLPEIKNVIHSAPATIVFWMDGTKTVVKAVNEEYDPEKGIAMAFMKKMLGNKGNYFNQIKKWLPKETVAKVEQASEQTEAKAEEDVEQTETEEKITCPLARCHLCRAPHECCPFDRNPDRLIPKSKYVEWVTAVTGVEPKEEA